MGALFINTGLAFIEGFALIISPCILPILPIILTGSLAGKKSRPMGIILGFVITFTLVTLFSRALVAYTNISSDLLRDISYGLLFFLGVVMLSSTLTEKFNLLTSRLANVGSSLKGANNPQSGLVGGLIFGGLVGVVWTPCAGPILAAVIVQAIVQHTTLGSVLVVSAFALGAGVPMLVIAFLGRQLLNEFSFFKENTLLLRKLLGILIILSVVFLIYESRAALALSEPTYSEKNSSVFINGLEHPYTAPAIGGINTWINSPPLDLNALKGKVVLIDFWTYSCINCIRTLPYLKDWYQKYHDLGFVIIGIHSPEFDFERNPDNVKNAVLKDGIHYPVALDNNYVTWQNFHNLYWPAHYLINKEGMVVYEHFGEGEYDVTENNIRYLLGIKGTELNSATGGNYYYGQTPETYFGYAKSERFDSPENVVRDKAATYSYPASLPVDHWALQGEWTIYPDKIVATSAGASIKLHFKAGQVFAVLGMPGKSDVVKVVMAGNPPVMINGHEGPKGEITVAHQQLYEVLNLKMADEGTVELIATEPGLEAYTFTFGG